MNKYIQMLNKDFIGHTFTCEVTETGKFIIICDGKTLHVFYAPIQINDMKKIIWNGYGNRSL